MSKKYNERELESDYPIYQGYLYVCDGKVWQSDRTTSVSTLRMIHKFKSIKNCDISARDLYHKTI